MAAALLAVAMLCAGCGAWRAERAAAARQAREAQTQQARDVAARAAPQRIEAMVHDGPQVRRVYVDRTPRFFAYLDRSDGGSLGEKVSRVHRRVEEQGGGCIGRRDLGGGDVAHILQDLPTSPNYFTFVCDGNCANVKYSIATNQPGYIFHYGLREEFPTINAKGPATYFHQANIGFIFFEDLPGARKDIVARQDAPVRLPPGTRVTIIHWGSPLVGSACPG